MDLNNKRRLTDMENVAEKVVHPAKCARCATAIPVGERYFGLNLMFEAVEPGGGCSVYERHALTQLCFGCASMLLTEMAAQKKMLRPLSLVENLMALKKRTYGTAAAASPAGRAPASG
jgi:hypothetical protein